jgi:cytidyltransferase-like protein
LTKQQFRLIIEYLLFIVFFPGSALCYSGQQAWVGRILVQEDTFLNGKTRPFHDSPLLFIPEILLTSGYFMMLMTRVLVFGVFDFFHPGHLGFLRMAARQGDELIVSVARDTFVTSFKKKSPMFSESERQSRIAELDFVGKAVLSDKETGKYTVVKEFMPNVICFGHDQNELQAHCESWLAAENLPVKTVKMDLVRHIRKDYAFLSIKENSLANLHAFSHVSAEALDGSLMSSLYAVYNRDSELKAIISLITARDEADLSVFFENNRDYLASDNSLLRESAYFLKFLRNPDKSEFKFNFPGNESSNTVISIE